MKIHATSPTEANNDTINDIRLSGPHYFADTLLKVQQYQGHLNILDLTNAMNTGKSCLEVKFVAAGHNWEKQNSDVTNLIAAYNCNYKLLFDNLREMGAEALKNWQGVEIELDGIAGKVYLSEEKAVRTYSPFAKVAALKEEPKKWTAAHVVKALLNRQFESIKCQGKYTDDYAFDAAYNFQQGEHEDKGRSLIEKLVTRPDGWWFNNEGGNWVGVNCYHFEYHAFKFSLVPVVEETEKAAA